jgi:hypothetical protein
MADKERGRSMKNQLTCGRDERGISMKSQLTCGREVWK